MEEWSEILDSKGEIHVIYCDFMKAFDKGTSPAVAQKTGIIQTPLISPDLDG